MKMVVLRRHCNGIRSNALKPVRQSVPGQLPYKFSFFEI